MQRKDRYCRNCGQELLREDRFCAGCGRPVHETAHVPTPEADIPVPPVQMPARQPQKGQHDGAQAATRGPNWGMLAVFMVLIAGRTAMEMPTASSGETFAYRLGAGMAIPLVLSVFLAALILVVGGVYYVTARKDGITFGEAVFNWPIVILAAGIVFLALL